MSSVEGRETRAWLQRGQVRARVLERFLSFPTLDARLLTLDFWGIAAEISSLAPKLLDPKKADSTVGKPSCAVGPDGVA